MSSSSNVRGLGPLQVVLLAIPCIAVLIVPWFNRVDPEIAGIPFFYWWQMLWVPLSGVFIAIVYRMVVTPGSTED